MKKYFIQLTQLLQDFDLIESRYKIISNGKIYSTNELSPNNSSEGVLVYKKLTI